MLDFKKKQLEERFDVPFATMNEYLSGMEVDEIRPDISLSFEGFYARLMSGENARFKTLAESKERRTVEWGHNRSESAVVYANIHCLDDGSYENIYFDICGIFDGFEFSSDGPIFSLYREDTAKNLVQSYFVGKHIENEQLLNLMPQDIDLYKTVETMYVKEIVRLAKIADEKIKVLKGVE